MNGIMAGVGADADADPAAGWNRWYSNMAGDRASRDDVQQRHLSLPSHLRSTSLLT